MNGAGNKSVTHLVIGEDDPGQRLDNFLIRVCKGVPKSHVYRILRSGEVRVNGRRAAAGYRLCVGDVLRLPPLRIAERPEGEVDEAAKQRVDLPILYEDEAMLVIDKPDGIAVHGGSGVSFGVIEALRRQRPDARFLELAHRLDRETSGVLLIGKKRLALTALHDMFREHGAGADKRYLVLVRGRWMNGTQHVRLPLHKCLTEEGERRVSVSPQGKAAHTVFRLLARWPDNALGPVGSVGRTTSPCPPPSGSYALGSLAVARLVTLMGGTDSIKKTISNWRLCCAGSRPTGQTTYQRPLAVHPAGLVVRR